MATFMTTAELNSFDSDHMVHKVQTIFKKFVDPWHNWPRKSIKMLIIVEAGQWIHGESLDSSFYIYVVKDFDNFKILDIIILTKNYRSLLPKQFS